MEIENRACPVRDNRWVEMKKRPCPQRAVRYGIRRRINLAKEYIAYQPVGGHGLRHAVLYMFSVFYPYSVPTGQVSSVKSLHPFKSVILIIYDIVKAHGGDINIKMVNNERLPAEAGTEFVIYLQINHTL